MQWTADRGSKLSSGDYTDVNMQLKHFAWDDEELGVFVNSSFKLIFSVHKM